MRTYILFFAIAGAALFQTACKKASIKTTHGYDFTNFTNLEGVKAQPGEAVLVSIATYVGDSLMGSTYKTGGPREIQIPELDKMPPKVPPIFDALLLMAKGDSASVIQELDSMMIKSLPPALKKEKQLRFLIKLVNITSKSEQEEKEKAAIAQSAAVETSLQATLAAYKAKTLGDRLKKTASGLEYVVEEQGTGAAITEGEMLSTDYIGVLLADGKKFDASYDRGEPLKFTVGQMIPGFNEGVMLLNHGGKATFFIPWKIGYGAEGHPSGVIGPKADLVFYVDVK